MDSADHKAAIATYHYLRIGLVALTLLLAAALLLHSRQAGGFEPSISAYFHTPVRPVFVGVLFATGIGLIAYSSSSDLEDVLLNLSGIMAFFVATIPTPEPGVSADPGAVTGAIEYGARAVVIVCALGYSAEGLLNHRWWPVLAPGMSPDQVRTARRARYVSVGAVVIVAAYAAVIFYAAEQTVRNLHLPSAVLLFVGMGAVAWLNAIGADHKGYVVAYRLAAAGMILFTVVAGGAAVRAHMVGQPPGHLILVLEVALIAFFIMFWVAQSLELHGRMARDASDAATVPPPSA